MRRLPWLLLALASCGPTRPYALSRYVVVTTVPESDPLHREIEALAEFRLAEILHTTSFTDPDSPLASLLADRAPDYVAAVVRPAELTLAQADALVGMLCALDDDPFPDAALGWFLATDTAFLRRQVQTLRGAEAKVEKRLLQTTILRAGPASDRSDRLEWATGLPVRRLEAPPADTAFLEARLPALQRCDYLLLGVPPLRGLRLDSAVVFSEVPGSGNPFRPWLADLLQAGAAGLFASLAEERAADAEREWADAIATDRELGEIWRRSAELAVLSGGSRAARLLFGCPQLDVCTRPARPPWKEISARYAGRSFSASVQIVSWDNPAAFADPSGNERAHLRFSAPRGLQRVRVLEVRGEAQGRPVPVSAAAASLERRTDADVLHVLLRAPRLALEDLLLHVSLEVE